MTPDPKHGGKRSSGRPGTQTNSTDMPRKQGGKPSVPGKTDGHGVKSTPC